MASELTTGQSLRNQTLDVPKRTVYTLDAARWHPRCYTYGRLTPQTAYWDTGTGRLPAPYRPTHADLQKDGNLVLSNDSMNPAGVRHPGRGRHQREVSDPDDGNLVIHLPNGTPFWAVQLHRAGASPPPEHGCASSYTQRGPAWLQERLRWTVAKRWKRQPLSIAMAQ